MRKRALSFLVAIIICLITLIPFRESILEQAAETWIIRDQTQSADIIILPGGQIATRPPAAAQLFLEGHASRIFLLRESANPLLHADTPGLERAEFVADYLKRTGVPRDKLILSKARPDSTWEEASQFTSWRRQQPEGQRPMSALLVTDAFHSRRARWCFQKQIPEMEFLVISVPHRFYGSHNWWKTPQGVQDFRSEVGKWIAYRFGYRG